MKEFVSDKNTDGVRLDKFMCTVMPAVKFGEICKALRKKKVRINGKHQNGTYRLVKGDVIQIYMNDELFGGSSDTDDIKFSFMECSKSISVLYEDENIIITDKPTGLPSQESDGGMDSLENRVRHYLYKKGEIDINAAVPFIPSLCHRIDRNTSGLVIAAKNAAALRAINSLIKEKKIRKFYLCRTDNLPPASQGEISGWLAKDGKSRKMRFYDARPTNIQAHYCQTFYRVISSNRPYLIEAELLTGRTHQIRASFAHIGCPLCGDVKYGAQKNNQNTYQELNAYKLIFDFKPSGGITDYLSGRVFELSLNLD